MKQCLSAPLDTLFNPSGECPPLPRMQRTGTQCPTTLIRLGTPFPMLPQSSFFVFISFFQFTLTLAASWGSDLLPRVLGALSLP